MAPNTLTGISSLLCTTDCCEATESLLLEQRTRSMIAAARRAALRSLTPKGCGGRACLRRISGKVRIAAL